MKLAVFGPNLRDQSKGQFVIHKDGCRDSLKLEGEQVDLMEAGSQKEISSEIYSDMIAEESMNETDAFLDCHFCPCVTIPVE